MNETQSRQLLLKTFWPTMLQLLVLNVVGAWVVQDLWWFVFIIIAGNAAGLGFCYCYGWCQCREEHIGLIEAYQKENDSLRRLTLMERAS